MTTGDRCCYANCGRHQPSRHRIDAVALQQAREHPIGIGSRHTTTMVTLVNQPVVHHRRAKVHANTTHHPSPEPRHRRQIGGEATVIRGHPHHTAQVMPHHQVPGYRNVFIDAPMPVHHHMLEHHYSVWPRVAHGRLRRPHVSIVPDETIAMRSYLR